MLLGLAGPGYGQYQAIDGDASGDDDVVEQVDATRGEGDDIAAQVSAALDALEDEVLEPDEDGVAEAQGADVNAGAMEICRERVAEIMEGRAILFGSGSARLVSDSEIVLADVAGGLALCPQAPVYVEGHTDSDGGDAANLVLSVTRAEAVIDVLIDLGVAPERLYAVGYGASLPIASNDTASGKAQNRRIVFSFEDIAVTLEDTDS